QSPVQRSAGLQLGRAGAVRVADQVDRVLAASLGAEHERLVGLLDQRLWSVRIEGEDRQPATDGEGALARGAQDAEIGGTDQSTEAIADCADRLRHARWGSGQRWIARLAWAFLLGKDDGELIAADARHQVARPAAAAHQGCRLLEDLIAHAVAVA